MPKPTTKKYHYVVTETRICPWTYEVKKVRIRCAIFCRNKTEFHANLAMFNHWGRGLKTYKAA